MELNDYPEIRDALLEIMKARAKQDIIESSSTTKTFNRTVYLGFLIHAIIIVLFLIGGLFLIFYLGNYSAG